MYNVVCSLVIYKNDPKQLLEAINSFLNSTLKIRMILIDNSPTDDLKNIKISESVEYIHNPSNPGYGTSHNIGINKFLNQSEFHLILNPDIYFSEGVIEDLYDYMNKNLDIGLIMPKVLYPNGEIQYLAKLLPSPFVFFARRFIPIKRIVDSISNQFELRFTGYDKIIEAPYLSGCFMFFRTSALQKINGFDENIFMHMEDLDISRRCYESGFKNIFYPKKQVYHDHLYKTFFTFSNVKMYFYSAFYYFNKWGWFFDKKRDLINKEIIKKSSSL